MSEFAVKKEIQPIKSLDINIGMNYKVQKK